MTEPVKKKLKPLKKKGTGTSVPKTSPSQVPAKKPEAKATPATPQAKATPPKTQVKPAPAKPQAQVAAKAVPKEPPKKSAEHAEKQEKATSSASGLTVELDEPAPYGIFIFPLIGAAIFIFALGLNLSPAMYRSLGMGLSFSLWSTLTSVVIVLLLLVMGLNYYLHAPAEDAIIEPDVHPSKKKEIKAKDEEDEDDGEAPEVEEEPEDIAPKGEQTMVEYPKKLTGGIYGDAVIQIDPSTKLRLRTLMARSCLLCDHQEKCWEEYSEFLGHEDFLSNSDCKRYLNEKRDAAGGQ